MQGAKEVTVDAWRVDLKVHGTFIWGAKQNRCCSETKQGCFCGGCIFPIAACSTPSTNAEVPPPPHPHLTLFSAFLPQAWNSLLLTAPKLPGPGSSPS